MSWKAGTRRSPSGLQALWVPGSVPLLSELWEPGCLCCSLPHCLCSARLTQAGLEMSLSDQPPLPLVPHLPSFPLMTCILHSTQGFLHPSLSQRRGLPGSNTPGTLTAHCVTGPSLLCCGFPTGAGPRRALSEGWAQPSVPHAFPSTPLPTPPSGASACWGEVRTHGSD